MKTLLTLFIVCIIALAAAFVFDKALPEQIDQFINYSPCNTPITYAIDAVSPEFHISKEEFTLDVQQASSLWSEAEGKPLFILDPSAPLRVSLQYDQRQYLDSQINQLQQKVQQDKGNLTAQISAFKAKEAAFATRLTSLNDQIAYWNAKGGAPEEVFTKLINEQSQLKEEGNSLNSEAQSLNLSTTQYNTQVGLLNQTVNSFNQALARKPEEGLFDPNNQTIVIYIAPSHDELIHTLTHEFGHALGLGHVGDPNAIMYSYATDTRSLTQDDISALNKICQVQSLQYRMQVIMTRVVNNVSHIL